jgi:hypothetical protein
LSDTVSSVLDHRREQDAERQQGRERPKQPTPALQFGTRGWASAMGNQAVARIARQPVEELEEAEAETESAVAEAPVDEAEAGMAPEGAEAEVGEEAESEAEMIPDDLPDELPE